MKKKTIYIIVIIVLAVLILLSALFFKKPQEDQKPTNLTACNKDADCIKVQASCCSCNMGGEEKCILSSEKSIYDNKLKNCSERAICIAMYACRQFACKCIDGICTE